MAKFYLTDPALVFFQPSSSPKGVKSVGFTLPDAMAFALDQAPSMESPTLCCLHGSKPIHSLHKPLLWSHPQKGRPTSSVWICRPEMAVWGGRDRAKMWGWITYVCVRPAVQDGAAGGGKWGGAWARTGSLYCQASSSSSEASDLASQPLLWKGYICQDKKIEDVLFDRL